MLSTEVENVAVVTPDVVLTAPVPICEPPSLNVTVPVGKAPAVVPGLVTEMVAVKITNWPDTDVLFAVDEVTATEVDAGSTI